MAKNARRPTLKMAEDLQRCVANFLNYGTQLRWRDNMSVHGQGLRAIGLYGTPEEFLKLPGANKMEVTLIACALYPASPEQVVEFKAVRTQGILWYLSEYYWTLGADRRNADRLIETLKKSDPDNFAKHMQKFHECGMVHLANFTKLIAKWHNPAPSD